MSNKLINMPAINLKFIFLLNFLLFKAFGWLSLWKLFEEPIYRGNSFYKCAWCNPFKKFYFGFLPILFPDGPCGLFGGAIKEM